ncbi:hypothetical protein FB451DRAFT_1178062 [Mycena latifolia]|nr:hypothetical protein FB451DRAFT_1178062 [Mycena latifolia]
MGRERPHIADACAPRHLAVVSAHSALLNLRIRPPAIASCVKRSVKPRSAGFTGQGPRCRAAGAPGVSSKFGGEQVGALKPHARIYIPGAARSEPRTRIRTQDGRAGTSTSVRDKRACKWYARSGLPARPHFARRGAPSPQDVRSPRERVDAQRRKLTCADAGLVDAGRMRQDMRWEAPLYTVDAAAYCTAHTALSGAGPARGAYDTSN